jgi:hypothetical protein
MMDRMATQAYRQITELKDKLAKGKLYLEEEIRTEHNFDEIVGESAALRRVLKEVETVAPTDSTVLIRGETGTGKELIAIEPGHTAAEFWVRHMMVCWVRGHFKDVHGSLEFDAENPTRLTIQATIDAGKLWSGEPQRDDHLRSGDFIDAEKHLATRF